MRTRLCILLALTVTLSTHAEHLPDLALPPAQVITDQKLARRAGHAGHRADGARAAVGGVVCAEKQARRRMHIELCRAGDEQ